MSVLSREKLYGKSNRLGHSFRLGMDLNTSNSHGIHGQVLPKMEDPR